MLTNVNNVSAKFMAKNNRIIHWPTVICGPLMEVAAANAYVGYFKEHIVLADFRFYYCAQFYRTFFR